MRSSGRGCCGAWGRGAGGGWCGGGSGWSGIWSGWAGQLSGSGRGRARAPGAGGRGGGRVVRGGWGGERDLVGLGGTAERVRPRRALCAACGVSRVLLPDSMLRRRQYGVEVIWAALLAAARGGPWNQIAAQLGVPYTTVREWLRRFARRADRVHAWLCGLLPRLVDDPVWPSGTPGAAGDALAV